MVSRHPLQLYPRLRTTTQAFAPRWIHLQPRPLRTPFTAAAYSSSPPSPTTSSPSNVDPLNPAVLTDSLGLPLTPPILPPHILDPPLSPLSLQTLHRLHRLAAIEPPPSGSNEEKKLLSDLSKLVGLMDQVKDVILEVKEGQTLKDVIGDELKMGAWTDAEDVFDGSRIDEEIEDWGDQVDQDGRRDAQGRELLKWAKSARQGMYVFESKRLS